MNIFLLHYLLYLDYIVSEFVTPYPSEAGYNNSLHVNNSSDMNPYVREQAMIKSGKEEILSRASAGMK